MISGKKWITNVMPTCIITLQAAAKFLQEIHNISDLHIDRIRGIFLWSLQGCLFCIPWLYDSA